MGDLSLANIASVSDLHLKPKQYLMFTLNRKVLMNDKANLERMLKAMLEAAGNMPIVAPLRENAAQIVRSLDAAKHANLCSCSLWATWILAICYRMRQEL